ncbi:MAG: hypothetical protein M3Z33_01400 [Actinomycetota bacterium]|nr:hypothetical protein [Actinomycetota bacterium]
MGRHRPPRTLLLVVAAGFIGLLLLAAADRRGFRLGLNTESVVMVEPGQEACRTLIRPPQAGANRVTFWVSGTSADRSAPPVTVRIRKGRQSQLLAIARLTAGPAGQRQARLRGSLAGSRKVAACFTNAGAVSLRLMPRPGTPTRVVPARLTEASDNVDVALELAREPERSLLSELPDSFQRAALFRPGWVGAWTFWLLLAALVIGVPALLGRALRAALAEEDAEASRLD